MKDIQWLLGGGAFFLLFLMAVMAGNSMEMRNRGEKKEDSEAVWEPQVEMAGDDMAETNTEYDGAEPEAQYPLQEEHCLITG